MLLGMKAFLFIIALCYCLSAANGQQMPAQWQHLSTENGDLALPGESSQQTGAVIADINRDGINDFVLTFRQKPPSILWYERNKNGWVRHVIEDDYLTIEAGATVCDIDNDGDLDIIAGGDYQSNEVWWWENPYPHFDHRWERRIIKRGGENMHHDQLTGNFRNDQSKQLVFWNQNAKTLFISDIPVHPKEDEWSITPVFIAGKEDESHGSYVEGLASGDIDGDGKPDIIAGNYWFKFNQSDKTFKAIQYADAAGRVAAGKFIAGKTMQIVVSPGDGSGPVKWYESKGDPEDPASWIGHDLAGRVLVHGHSLAIADINNDGNADIFVAEMAKWTESKKDPDNPGAEALIFYGDGKGNFRKEIFIKGFGFHEAKLDDLDGDGDIDILSKPYNWKVPRIDIWLQNGTGHQHR